MSGMRIGKRGVELPLIRFLVPARSPARIARAAGPTLASMKDVKTYIDIQAPASLVWAILTDFGTYQRWNPLMRGVLGRAVIGTRIEVRFRSPRGDDVGVRSIVVRVREPRELHWLERWSVPGMFSSEHRFRIESLPEGGIRFHHIVKTRGMLAPLLGQRRRLREKTGFDAMNSALKQRAERACLKVPVSG